MSAKLGRRHTRKRAVGVVLTCVLALALAAPAGAASATGAVRAAKSSPCAHAQSTSAHETELAEGETAVIAANLVPVKGTCYVDVSADEQAAELLMVSQLTDSEGTSLVESVSLHSVISNKAAENTARAGNGRELGFLELFAFTPAAAPPAGIEEQLVSVFTNGDEVGSFTANGTKVYVFSDPTSRDSRWYLAWVRHGVAAVLDGATRPLLEKWTRAYLAKPVLVGDESAALSKALVPVDGFVYANFLPEGTDFESLHQGFVTDPIGDVAWSSHQVVNSEYPVGGLVLAEAPTSMTTESYAQALQQGTLSTATLVGIETIGSTPVAHFTISSGGANGDGADIFVWVRDGVAGVGMTSYPADYQPFLEAFLSTLS
ncbi:MAG: hypothetical protein U0W40_01610 [Acidimicrobiia bacterium]